MSEQTHKILTTSEEPNWRTPSWLQEALKREFDIRLDAAATASDTIAGDWFGPGSGMDDALAIEAWGAFVAPREAIFCNPPYSRKLKMPITPWIARMAEEGQHRTVIGLIPYAPQTRAWRRYVVGFEHRATEIRKFPFRLKFEPPEGYVSKAKDGKTHGANVNTAVVIWKPTGEYPKALPWGPFERYWVPAEVPKGQKYHEAAETDDEGE